MCMFSYSLSGVKTEDIFSSAVVFFKENMSRYSGHRSICVVVVVVVLCKSFNVDHNSDITVTFLQVRFETSYTFVKE